MERVYSKRRHLGKQRKSREYKGIGRRVWGGVQRRGQRTKMTGAGKRREEV